MTTTWYIWKWTGTADQDGPPAEIVARLCAGDAPPVLEPFSAGDVLENLAQVADQCRARRTELFIAPARNRSGALLFIEAQTDAQPTDELDDCLLRAIWPARLTLYRATQNRLLGLPKRNVVELPSGRQLVDIRACDVPVLLHECRQTPRLTALACYDREGNMFQAWAHGSRFAVEWQVLPERDFNRHRIWVAGHDSARSRPRRLGHPDGSLPLRQGEILTMAQAQELWLAFLAERPKPAAYSWREITNDLNTPGTPRRQRHQPKEHS